MKLKTKGMKTVKDEMERKTGKRERVNENSFRSSMMDRDTRKQSKTNVGPGPQPHPLRH